MANKSNNKGGGHFSPNVIYGIIFVVISVIGLVALSVVLSRADTVSQTGSVTNDDPSIDSITISESSLGSADSSLTLTENANKTIYVHGTATDNNGCEDIDDTASATWGARLYRTGVGNNCTASDNNCYTITPANEDITGCSAGGSDLNVVYEFDFDLKYFADATDAGSSPDFSSSEWTAGVKVTDNNNGDSNFATTTAEVATLKALNVTSDKSYGEVALGATSAEQTLTITNTGNDDDLDPTIEQASTWSCTIGTIPQDQLHWSDTSSFAYADATSVTSSAVDLNDASIEKGAGGTHEIYTQLYISTTGVGGSCTSTLTFTAA
jgi:hypothetical protein